MDTNEQKPMRLFVSHISEEASIAALLKRMLEKDFLGLVTLFASSEIGCIHGGANWLDAIREEMNGATAVIVLCSRASIKRPWVQFELGAAWIRKVPIVPVCHSGMKLADLSLPLSLLQGVELSNSEGIDRLYGAVAEALKLQRAPRVSDLSSRLRQLLDAQKLFRDSPVQQFERHIDIVVPAPGVIAGTTIPEDTIVESNEDSFKLFGYIGNESRLWADIVKAAQKRADRRWLRELEGSIVMASNNEDFQPVQAIYHTDLHSYQPQLSKKEVMPNGDCRFHVHLVQTVVAPLSEVPNEFGLLATLLRLGLRFRHEVIERCRSRLKAAVRIDGTQPADADILTVLRTAVETIENDALSRGAEKMDRGAVSELFDCEADQDEMAMIQREWQTARDSLFRVSPPLTNLDVSESIQRMRGINFRFMDLGTRRFHEMVHERWANVPK